MSAFLRWQSRSRTTQSHWFSSYIRGERIDCHWQAVVVRTLRVDGKHRQEHIKTLGGITESDMANAEGRLAFWRKARERLDRLANQITPDDRQAIELSILTKFAEVLSRPPITEEEKKERLKLTAEIYKESHAEVQAENQLLKSDPGLKEARKQLRQQRDQLLDDFRSTYEK